MKSWPTRLSLVDGWPGEAAVTASCCNGLPASAVEVSEHASNHVSFPSPGSAACLLGSVGSHLTPGLRLSFPTPTE